MIAVAMATITVFSSWKNSAVGGTIIQPCFAFSPSSFRQQWQPRTMRENTAFVRKSVLSSYDGIRVMGGNEKWKMVTRLHKHTMKTLLRAKDKEEESEKVNPESEDVKEVIPTKFSPSIKSNVDQLKEKEKKSKLMKRKIELTWCGRDSCINDDQSMRERVTTNTQNGCNDIEFEGPATGQVLFGWKERQDGETDPIPSVLLLVKRGDDDLMITAAAAVQNLTAEGVRVLLHPEHAAKLKHYFGVDNDDMIKLFESRPVPGFGGSHVAPMDNLHMSGYGFDFLAAGNNNTSAVASSSSSILATPDSASSSVPSALDEEFHPDLICTLGGDGLLMHVSMLFPGPAPPVLSVAGGSLGFLTPFSKAEMCDAIFAALGVEIKSSSKQGDIIMAPKSTDETTSPQMSRNSISAVDVTYDNVSNNDDEENIVRPKKITFGSQNAICLSMRMRLDCRVINREGVVRARFNVLNEVTIDRGSSPYLANLECFCDNVHLTTVQADGVILSTPTGSTAYSMAAGGSVVHPAVPAILVTPICPHVLSFRPMVLPDHVVLRCYVPDDARSDACVAFDGKYRRELHRGDSVQVQMSVHPLPTINREDHSSDWLNGLKRNFNFNTRARQRPL